jgi:hypothetical protein
LVHPLLEHVGYSIIVLHGLFLMLGQYGRQRGNVAHSSNAGHTPDIPFRISDERLDETK